MRAFPDVRPPACAASRLSHTRDVRQLFTLADLDGNGLLDFNEFVGLQVRSRTRELERHETEIAAHKARGRPTHVELYTRVRRRSTRAD